MTGGEWCGPPAGPSVMGIGAQYACYISSALGPSFLALVLASAAVQTPKLLRLRTLSQRRQREIDGWGLARAANAGVLAFLHLLLLIFAVSQVCLKW